MLGLLVDPETLPPARIDPVKRVVQVALLIYLAPVILVVMAIGLTSVVIGGIALGITRLAARGPLGKNHPTATSNPPTDRRIGSRPIRRNPSRRSRIHR